MSALESIRDQLLLLVMQVEDLIKKEENAGPQKRSRSIEDLERRARVARQFQLKKKKNT